MIGPREENDAMGSMSIWHWAIVIVRRRASCSVDAASCSGIMGGRRQGHPRLQGRPEGRRQERTARTTGVSSLPRTDAEKEELEALVVVCKG